MRAAFLQLHSFTLLSILLISSVGICIYSNSLNGSFVFDDLSIILFNPAIKHINDFELLWASFNTRIVTGWSFAWNYSFGKLHTFGYHVVNTCIHILNGICVFFLLKEILKTPYFQKCKKCIRPDFLCLFSALIFTAHPIQSQAVSFITQRASSLATFLYLLTLIFYIKSRLQQSKRLTVLCLLTLILGMLTKEMTVTLPIMFIAVEFYFFSEGRQDFLSHLKKMAPWLCMLAFIPLLLYFDRPYSVLRLKSQISAITLNPYNFLTEINVLKTYLRLLIFPIYQNLDYDYPLTQTVFSLSTFLSAGLLVLLIGTAVRLFRNYRLYSFCITWFFITISVETLVCALIGNDLIFEHYLYLPMVGFAILSSLTINHLSKTRHGFLTVATLLIVLLGIMTYQRNKVWDNPISLWTDVLKKSPNKVRPYVNLGFAYRMLNDYPRAMEYYRMAITRKNIKNKSRAQILVNMSAIYGRMGNYQQEIEHCLEALKYDTRHVQAISNLSYAYYLLKDYEKALFYGRKAVHIAPNYVQGLINLGVVKWAVGEREESILLYKKALKLDPDNKTAYKNFRFAHSLLYNTENDK